MSGAEVRNERWTSGRGSNPLTEVDEKATVALALVLWKNHDARHVVLLLTVLLLEEEAGRQGHEERWRVEGEETN